MDYAKSMYLAKTVKATDILDYKDSRELGLRCRECGQEVFLKKPKIRKPHFSHYKEREWNEEECPFRVPQLNQNKNPLLDLSSDEGKEQRLEFFEQHLLDIISETYTDFYKSDFSTFTKNEIEQKSNVFRNNQALVIRSLDYVDSDLARKEVIDYITKKSKKHLLMKIIAYAMYKNNSDNQKQFSFNVKELLQEVDWLHFLKHKNEYITKFNNQVKEKDNLDQKKLYFVRGNIINKNKKSKHKTKVKKVNKKTKKCNKKSRNQRKKEQKKEQFNRLRKKKKHKLSKEEMKDLKMLEKEFGKQTKTKKKVNK